LAAALLQLGAHQRFYIGYLDGVLVATAEATMDGGTIGSTTLRTGQRSGDEGSAPA
jgi:hypothetical protein